MAKWLDLLEYALHIPQVVDQIGQNDRIKFFGEVEELVRIAKEEGWLST